MGIDRESDTAANLQIGPTTLGMVRLFVETEAFDLPLDFEPDEAEEIAAELVSAAARAREIGPGRGGKDGGGGPAAEGGQAKSKRRRGTGSSKDASRSLATRAKR